MRSYNWINLHLTYFMTWGCKISNPSWEIGIIFLMKESDLNLSREMLQRLLSSCWHVHQPKYGWVHVCDLSLINWTKLWLKTVDLKQKTEKSLLIFAFMAQFWLLSRAGARRNSFMYFCSSTSFRKSWCLNNKKLNLYLKQIKYWEDVKDTEHLKWNGTDGEIAASDQQTKQGKQV